MAAHREFQEKMLVIENQGIDWLEKMQQDEVAELEKCDHSLLCQSDLKRYKDFVVRFRAGLDILEARGNIEYFQRSLAKNCSDTKT